MTLQCCYLSALSCQYSLLLLFYFHVIILYPVFIVFGLHRRGHRHKDKVALAFDVHVHTFIYIHFILPMELREIARPDQMGAVYNSQLIYIKINSE